MNLSKLDFFIALGELTIGIKQKIMLNIPIRNDLCTNVLVTYQYAFKNYDKIISSYNSFRLYKREQLLSLLNSKTILTEINSLEEFIAWCLVMANFSLISLKKAKIML